MFKKYLIALFSYLYLMPTLAAIEMQVDRDTMASDEVLTLLISSKDHLSIAPDLSPLRKDFYIIGTSQSSQFTVINGSSQTETRWQVALLPKHGGDILLPELQVGNDKTPTRLIHVSAGKKSTPPTPVVRNQDMFIEAHVIPKEPYIQEQFVYTLKFFATQAIGNPYLIPPDLAGAKISQNGQDIIYTVVKNGRYYHVMERSYLITPTSTGTFQIRPPVLKGYVADPLAQYGGYGFPGHILKPIEIVGPTIAMTVKPKPGNFSGQWLPAKKLILKEYWEPNPPIFREGEPVTRIIEVNAEGATGDQIPNLVISNSPNLNHYTQQPQRETNVNGDMQVGKLVQSVVYIPTVTGKLTLPPIKFHWWNSETQKEQLAQIPSRTITVLPALIKTPATNATKTVVQPASPSLALEGKTKNKESSTTSASIWPLIAILFIVLWLITMWLWRRQMRLGYVFKNSFKWQVSASAQDNLRRLKQACEMNKSKQARALFLAWAVHNWNNPALHSLADVVQVLEGEHAESLKAEIMQLEAIFYSHHRTPWKGVVFWHSLQEYLKMKEEKARSSHIDPLPPLYLSNVDF